MVGATTCLALCTLRWLATAWHFDAHANLHFVSHYRIDSILWGALGALTFAELRRRPAWRHCAVLFSIIAAVAALWTRNPSQPTPLQASVGLSAAALAATLLVVEVAATPRSVFTRVLDWLPLRSLGRVSYGMYLLHFQMMDVAFPLPFLLAGEYGRTSLMLSFLVFSATTWAAAEGLYRVLERPILTRRERWLRRVGR